MLGIKILVGLFYVGGELLGVHYFVVGYNTLKGLTSYAGDLFTLLPVGVAYIKLLPINSRNFR